MDSLLSKEFLQSIGVTLDEQTYHSLSTHYKETLNKRIIDTIMEDLDESQLKELANLKYANDGLLQDWLVGNVPLINKIIETEVAILFGDLAWGADSI